MLHSAPKLTQIRQKQYSEKKEPSCISVTQLARWDGTGGVQRACLLSRAQALEVRARLRAVRLKKLDD